MAKQYQMLENYDTNLSFTAVTYSCEHQ